MNWTRRVEVRVPTAAGWGAIGIAAAVLVASVLFGTYPFLAVADPVAGEVLVVEAWIGKAQAVEALDVFRRGPYRLLAVTGGHIEAGSYLRDLYPDADSFAEVLGQAYLDLGFGPDSLLVAPAPTSRRNRTYLSAVALRQSLPQDGSIRGVDVVTEGPHARRSRLLFALALGDRYDVGVIPIAPEQFDARDWYATSEGGTRVLKELVAYFYAKFLFWP